MSHPTFDPALNHLLQQFVDGVQAVLGDNFIGAYLQGSFALGAGDAHSDVDFVVVVERDIREQELPAMQALHQRLYDLPSPWAQHLEGSYFPRPILKQAEPVASPLLFLGNIERELERSPHDNTLVVRWVTREHGIILAGPAPGTLIDPILPDEMRREARAALDEWAKEILDNPQAMDNGWRQPFTVLGFCRMLYTLETGEVASKPAAALWAQTQLDCRWIGLVQRAWEAHPDPGIRVRQPADPQDLHSTFDFVRYCLSYAA